MIISNKTRLYFHCQYSDPNPKLVPHFYQILLCNLNYISSWKVNCYPDVGSWDIWRRGVRTQDDSHSRIKVKCVHYIHNLYMRRRLPHINLDINLSVFTGSPALHCAVYKIGTMLNALDTEQSRRT